MIVTTSRYASRAVRAIAADFAKSRKSVYVARGKRTIRQLAEYAWRKGHDKIALVREGAGRVAVDEVEIDHWGKWRWGGSYEILGKPES